MQLKAIPRAPKQKLPEGYIPAVAYNKDKNVTLAIEERAFDRVFRTQSTHGLVELELEGSETIPALVKAVQMDKRKRAPIHADFFMVTYGQPVEAPVPVHPVGKAQGVTQGGMLDVVVYNLNIIAPGPRRIPEEIRVDVSALGIGGHIAAGDIALPEGCTLAMPAETVIITVLPPRLSEEELAAEQASSQPASAQAVPASNQNDEDAQQNG